MTARHRWAGAHHLSSVCYVQSQLNCAPVQLEAGGVASGSDSVLREALVVPGAPTREDFPLFSAWLCVSNFRQNLGTQECSAQEVMQLISARKGSGLKQSGLRLEGHTLPRRGC